MADIKPITSDEEVEFEKTISEKLGVKHVITCSSCTTALHLALSALGMGKGQDVLVADYTFPATDGALGQYLRTNGLGQVYWSTSSGAGGDIYNNKKRLNKYNMINVPTIFRINWGISGHKWWYIKGF